MALDADACATAVTAAIKGVNPDTDEAIIKPYWTVICGAIIDHFKASGEVLPGTFMDSLSAPVTGKGEIS